MSHPNWPQVQCHTHNQQVEYVQCKQLVESENDSRAENQLLSFKTNQKYNVVVVNCYKYNKVTMTATSSRFRCYL